MLTKRNTNWLHVEFMFYNLDKDAPDYWHRFHKILDKDSSLRFKQLLKIIYTKCMQYIDRCFYLYEPNPHCFMAMELKDRCYTKTIERIIHDVSKVYLSQLVFIENMKLKFDTDDADNGEGFLNILNASTEFNLIHEDNSISHIIHCILNNCGFPRKKENNMYKLMTRLYR